MIYIEHVIIRQMMISKNKLDANSGHLRNHALFYLLISIVKKNNTSTFYKNS